jgi:hypothetical protein
VDCPRAPAGFLGNHELMNFESHSKKKNEKGRAFLACKLNLAALKGNEGSG